MSLTAPREDTAVEVGRLRRAWRSRTAFGLSALVVVAAVVVAAAAGLVEVVGGGHDAGRPPGPAVGAPAMPAATTDTDLSLPTTPFPVDWEVFQTVAFPVGGSTYGPAVRRPDGLVAGWAHTPRGAVLAALNIYSRVALAPDGQWQVLLDTTLLPGPGRDVLAAYHRQSTGQLRAPDGGFEQIAGFRVISYDPNVAVVSVASQRDPTDALQVTTSTVRWADGDWKAQLEPDGGESPYATQIPDLSSAGFVGFWAPR